MTMFGDLDDILIIIGILIVTFEVLDFLCYLIRIIRRQCPTNLLKRYGEGSWAVITGSSDGIGRGFAEQLAKRGFNLVLIARNQTKLEKVAKEVNDLNKSISIKIVVADFSKAAEPGFFDKIYHQIKELNVSLLVNNVGQGMLNDFHLESEPILASLISINVYPTVLLTRKLINHFRSRPDRSGVINVSSSGALAPMPYIGVYVATKRFEDHFSRSLQIEYPNIDFLSVLPGLVSTPMNMNKELGMDTISANDCAEGALRDLGRYERTSSHIKHDFTVFMLKILPKFILDYMVKNVTLPQEKERMRKATEAINKKS